MKSKIKRNLSLFALSVILLPGMTACNDAGKHAGVTDSPAKGSIQISADESFRPVIEEEVKVYQALFPETRLLVSYKPEASCFQDFYSDSLNRMIIVTRGLTGQEARFYSDSLGFTPVSDRLAFDAITLVINKNSTDTLFTVQHLHDLLSGKLGRKRSVVFDGLNATSTIRYALDSILRGDPLDTGVVKAVKNSAELLNFVANDPDAIGFVGISWIGNPEDTAQVNMLKKVKLGYLECALCRDSPYVKPTQAGIISRRYPLVRGLYYILKENFNGLGSGFVSFMKGQKGQLIFRRAYLAPVMDFGIRSVKINEKL